MSRFVLLSAVILVFSYSLTLPETNLCIGSVDVVQNNSVFPFFPPSPSQGWLVVGNPPSEKTPLNWRFYDGLNDGLSVQSVIHIPACSSGGGATFGER